MSRDARALIHKYGAIPAIEGLHDQIASLQAENDKLEAVLINCRETILYVRNYVSNSGLSAEDDCNDSLDKIKQALKGGT